MKKINLFGVAVLSVILSLTIFNIADAATDCTNTGITGVPQIECEALLSLYSNTAGAGWSVNTNWNTDSAVSTWAGVTVSGGRVTSIILAAKNLVGELPDEIGNLTSLTHLEIRNNAGLIGDIPSTIGNLTNLITLNVSANRFTGSIPSEINSLSVVTAVYLHGNKNITGEIPSMSGMTSLATLYLSDNQLTGAIPSGMPISLRNVYLHYNNLSGTIPNDLLGIPLTRLDIYTNNFVFSDLEPKYTELTAIPTFAYVPQRNADTVRTVTVNNGDTLTIEPSVAANANDSYQWYKGGIAISGATNRIYTKTATHSDNGVYTYKITNSEITDLEITSNNITVVIPPDPETPEKVFYIVNGNDVWVRGSISDEKDIANKYTFNSTNNSDIDFSGTYIVSSTTPNTVANYQAGFSMLNNYVQTDDSTPINTLNVGYIMAGHGLVAPTVTSVGHDKNSSDIGSTWTDGLKQYVLAEIAGNVITFYSKPYLDVDGVWKMVSIVGSGGTLNHVSGATHTGDIIYSARGTVQKYPVVTNLERQILVDGETEAENGDNDYADFVDMVEEFDLVDPSTIDLTNNPFEWNSATSTWMHVKHVYRAFAGGTIIHTTLEIEREINLGYIGFIQTAGMGTTTTYQNTYVYIPNAAVNGSYDFEAIEDFSVAPASVLIIDTQEEGNPVNRQVNLLKKQSEDNYDIGLAFGYSPFLDTAAEERECNTGNGCWWINTTKKTYPAVDRGITLNSGVTYEMYGYKQWVDPKATGENKIVYWNNQNGKDLVYVDYHKSVSEDIIDVPSRLAGREIRIVESKNIELTNNEVTNAGIVISTTGANTYGYAVLEILPAEEAVEENTTRRKSSGSRKRQLVQNIKVKDVEILTFAWDLKLGMYAEDVMVLQKFLNSHGYVLAATGPGSVGNETNYFGALTQNALIKFQRANGITPAIGYFGPITRAFISSHY